MAVPSSQTSSTPADHAEVLTGLRAAEAMLVNGATWQQVDDALPVRIVRRKAEAEQTTDANLEEWRNADNALVFYINEEGLPRVQNERGSKTVLRIRNGGASVNAIQVTNSAGTTTYYNVTAEGAVTAASLTTTGNVSAPNIGVTIQIATGAGQTGGILNAGQTPAGGNVAGVYLRRTT